MLVPMPTPAATTADMSFVRACPLTPETDTVVVTGILATGQAPRTFEFTLPVSVKAFAPVGIFVPPETLLSDSHRAIPFIIVRYLHLWASPERGRVADRSPSSSNPVYERLYYSRVSSSHLILLSVCLFSFSSFLHSFSRAILTFTVLARTVPIHFPISQSADFESYTAIFSKLFYCMSDACILNSINIYYLQYQLTMIYYDIQPPTRNGHERKYHENPEHDCRAL